jgi:hypothetical protein
LEPDVGEVLRRVDARARRRRTRRTVGYLGVTVVLIAGLSATALLFRSSRDASVGQRGTSVEIGPGTATATTLPAEPGVEFAFEGFAPSERVTVLQCHDASAVGDGCSLLDPVELTATKSGTVSSRLRPDQWIFTYSGWVDCTTTQCSIRAHQGQIVRETPIPAEVITPEPKPMPLLHVTTAGPYRPGQKIHIEASGMPPGELVMLNVCESKYWAPAESETGVCAIPNGATPIAVGRDGTFTIEGYELPPLRCAAPAPCELAWRLTNGAPPYVFVEVAYAGS